MLLDGQTNYLNWKNTVEATLLDHLLADQKW